MNDRRSSTWLAVGVGNPSRGDDAAGLLVTRHLERRGIATTQICSDLSRLIEHCKSHSRILVVDAVCANGPAGTIHRFDAIASPLPVEMFGGSSHLLGLAHAVELTRVLNGLPDVLVVYGIVGRCFDIGGTMSAQVAQACREVVKRILGELGQEKASIRQ